MIYHYTDGLQLSLQLEVFIPYRGLEVIAYSGTELLFSNLDCDVNRTIELRAIGALRDLRFEDVEPEIVILLLLYGLLIELNELLFQ